MAQSFAYTTIALATPTAQAQPIQMAITQPQAQQLQHHRQPMMQLQLPIGGQVTTEIKFSPMQEHGAFQTTMPMATTTSVLLQPVREVSPLPQYQLQPLTAVRIPTCPIMLQEVHQVPTYQASLRTPRLPLHQTPFEPPSQAPYQCIYRNSNEAFYQTTTQATNPQHIQAPPPLPIHLLPQVGQHQLVQLPPQAAQHFTLPRPPSEMLLLPAHQLQPCHCGMQAPSSAEHDHIGRGPLHPRPKRRRRVRNYGASLEMLNAGTAFPSFYCKEKLTKGGDGHK